jgi:hypothetical protein
MKTQLDFACEAVNQLCKSLAEQICEEIKNNDGIDFTEVKYGGATIDPTVLINAKLAKAVVGMDSAVDVEQKEKNLISLLITKHANKILKSAIQQVKQDAELQATVDLAKEKAKDPEVKRKRRVKIESAPVSVTSSFETVDTADSVVPESDATVAAVIEASQFVDTLSNQQQDVKDPFEAVLATDVTKTVEKKEIPKFDSMEDFLQAEKLKALAALSEDKLL